MLNTHQKGEKRRCAKFNSAPHLTNCFHYQQQYILNCVYIRSWYLLCPNKLPPPNFPDPNPPVLNGCSFSLQLFNQLFKRCTCNLRCWSTIARSWIPIMPFNYFDDSDFDLFQGHLQPSSIQLFLFLQFHTISPTISLVHGGYLVDLIASCNLSNLILSAFNERYGLKLNTLAWVFRNIITF